MDLHKHPGRPGSKIYKVFIILLISLAVFLLFQNASPAAQAKTLTGNISQAPPSQAAPIYGVKWGSHNTPSTLGTNLQVPVTITLTNTGTLTWPKDGDNPVYISYHWFKDGQVVVWDGLRTPLPKDLAAGQTATVSATLKAPSEVGNYALRWDLVRENVTWFASQGVVPLEKKVSIVVPPTYGILWGSHNTPSSLGTDLQVPISITLTNTGTLTWPRPGIMQYIFPITGSRPARQWSGRG